MPAALASQHSFVVVSDELPLCSEPDSESVFILFSESKKVETSSIYNLNKLKNLFI
jgi:hypothetical protein